MIIGVVGKANVGKSTFFKAATLAEVEIANYPFTTISKNEGIGFVKVKCVENEFKVKCKPKFGYCLDGFRFIPIQLIDVAGLIPGSYKGLGRGNQFLNDLIQADALIHVIDVSGSTNEKGEPVEDLSYDPANDIKFLETELDMWFLQLIKKNWENFKKKLKVEKEDLVKALYKQFSGLKVSEEMIKESLKELNEDVSKWNEKDLMKLASLLRKKSKPLIIACNKIDVNGSEKNFERLKKEFPDYFLVKCSAESELALKEAAKQNLIKYIPGENDFERIGKLNKKQEKALNFIKKFLDKHKITGVQEVLDKASFDLLKQIVVYPVENSKLTDKDGNVLPDAFLMNEESTALDLAYKIHTEIANKFVKAIDLKTKKVIGKDSQLGNNDVIEVLTK